MKIAILIAEATRAERGAASEGDDALRPFVFVDLEAGPGDLERFKFVVAEVEETRGAAYDGYWPDVSHGSELQRPMPGSATSLGG
jgi:hypothetical protein